MPNMTYQWERDDGDIAGANGSVYVASPGEVAENYVPVSGDIGHTVRLRASDGINTYYSGWSSAITALPTPVPPSTPPPPGTAPTYKGPFFAADGPWRTLMPSSWTGYVHSLTPGMVQDEYTGTDYSPADIHAFAYRPVEMQAKWGAIGLTYMKWAGPGGEESVIYAPNGAPTQTVWIDFPSFKSSSVQVPIPPGWTGYGQQNSSYFERRTAIYCENGDLWSLYGISPPGAPTRNGGPADSNWHATIATKITGGWAQEAPMFGGGGSGIPHGPGVIVPSDILYAQTYDDLGHVLSFNTSCSADGSFSGIPKAIWPAGKGYSGAPGGTNTDGRTKTNAGIPHGARIFLDPSLTDSDLNALGVVKTWQLWLAHTCQRYGLVSKESETGQGSAGGFIAEFQQSVDWNKAHGYYPSSFVWPWKADGSVTSDKDYGSSFPAALMPTSGSHWKVFDWNQSYAGITTP